MFPYGGGAFIDNPQIVRAHAEIDVGAMGDSKFPPRLIDHEDEAILVEDGDACAHRIQNRLRDGSRERFRLLLRRHLETAPATNLN